MYVEMIQHGGVGCFGKSSASQHPYIQGPSKLWYGPARFRHQSSSMNLLVFARSHHSWHDEHGELRAAHTNFQKLSKMI